MKPTRIVFRDYTLRLELRDVDDDDIEVVAPVMTVGDYYWKFMRQGKELVNAPQRNPTNRDLGVLRNLLNKYDQETLTECARRFWYRWAEPYFDNPRDVMVLFAKVLPDIERGIDKRPPRSAE